MGNGNDQGNGGVGKIHGHRHHDNGLHLGWKKHHHPAVVVAPLHTATSGLMGPTGTTTTGPDNRPVLSGGGGLSGVSSANSPTGTGVGQSYLQQDGLSGTLMTGALSNNALGLMEFT